MRISNSVMKTQKPPKLTLLPAAEMTQRQIAVWQRIANNHNRRVVLKNGLTVEPTGEVTVNEKLAEQFAQSLENFS